MMQVRPYLTRSEAADYLRSKGAGRTPKTLAKLASIGGGPRMVYFGRKPMYQTEELDQWVDSIRTPPVASATEFRGLNRRT